MAITTKSLIGIVGVVATLGCIVVVGILFGLSAVWVGSSELDVHVTVRDASNLEPIAGAKIELLEGPDATHRVLGLDMDKAFTAMPGSFSTDTDGYCNFDHSFWATGRDNLFYSSGNVDTRRVWLRVTASGYASTYLPIDQQSMQLRDINDKSPIWVTIPIGKQ